MNHPTRQLSAHRKAHSPSPFPLNLTHPYRGTGGATRGMDETRGSDE